MIRGTVAAGTFFRVLTPRWAHQPMSGEGSARQGGRYNRPGEPALYMSRDLETAWAEYQQTGALVRPGTVVAYEVTAAGIADLAHPDVLADLGATETDLLGLWRDIARVEGRDPPTWILADRLRSDGCNGLLASSAARPGGVNLVLWRWGETGPVRVVPQDPGHDLPRDQTSWRKRVSERAVRTCASGDQPLANWRIAVWVSWRCQLVPDGPSRDVSQYGRLLEREPGISRHRILANLPLA